MPSRSSKAITLDELLAREMGRSPQNSAKIQQGHPFRDTDSVAIDPNWMRSHRRSDGLAPDNVNYNTSIPSNFRDQLLRFRSSSDAITNPSLLAATLVALVVILGSGYVLRRQLLILFTALRRFAQTILRLARQRTALSFLPRLVSAVMLAVAPLQWPDDFYSLLRWFVFGTAILVAGIAVKVRRPTWAWLLGMIALLFNPLRPFHFDYEQVWQVADIGSAIVLLVSCPFVNEKHPSSNHASAADAA